jgi:ATP-dependent helicase/nuclease subunit B
VYAIEPDAPPMPQPAAPGLLPARISASLAQSLVDCPYQFYARGLLGLQQPEDVVEMPDKRDFGVALHEVLKRFHRAWGEVDFSGEPHAALAASLREHAAATFAAAAARSAGMLAFERRFEALVEPYLAWLVDRARAGWRWQASEAPYRQRWMVDGRTIELTGRVDRLDVAADGRVALLDYKARDAKQLRDALRVPGEDVQLPFYGLLLPQPPAEAAYLCFARPRDEGGGVREVAASDLAGRIDAVGRRLHADLERIAQGAPLPAHGPATVCERCEMRGLCRRDHWPAAEPARIDEAAQ